MSTLEEFKKLDKVCRKEVYHHILGLLNYRIIQNSELGAHLETWRLFLRDLETEETNHEVKIKCPKCDWIQNLIQGYGCNGCGRKIPDYEWKKLTKEVNNVCNK